jgi:hypothetical protein
LELHLGNAFRKGEMLKRSLSPAPDNTKRKISLEDSVPKISIQ